jgi:hypothetical protein
MPILTILQYGVCVLTIVIGVYALIWPRQVEGFTGLHAPGGRGLTEIRAVLGAFFIGLGAAPLLLQAGAAFDMLGIAYLTVGVVRAAAMFIDRSVVGSNLISVATEIIFGAVLLA